MITPYKPYHGEAEGNCPACSEPLTQPLVGHGRKSKHPIHEKCENEWKKNHTLCPYSDCYTIVSDFEKRSVKRIETAKTDSPSKNSSTACYIALAFVGISVLLTYNMYASSRGYPLILHH